MDLQSEVTFIFIIGEGPVRCVGGARVFDVSRLEVCDIIYVSGTTVLHRISSMSTLKDQ